MGTAGREKRCHVAWSWRNSLIISELRHEGGEGVSLDISGKTVKRRGQLVKVHSVGMCLSCLRNSKKTFQARDLRVRRRVVGDDFSINGARLLGLVRDCKAFDFHSERNGKTLEGSKQRL